jgi:hypothetical protein
MAIINFDPRNTQPFTGAFTVIPAGEYVVEIVDEQTLENRSGNGNSLMFEYQVLNGEYKGQRLRDYLHLWHSSQKAVDMARRRLTAIAKSLNTLDFTDTRALHRKPFVVRVGAELYNNVKRNTIDDYSPVNRDGQSQQPPHRPTRANAPVAAPAPAPSSAPPVLAASGSAQNAPVQESGKYW